MRPRFPVLVTTLIAAALVVPRWARAQIVPPVALVEPTAVWPSSATATTDVFVPLFIVVTERGEVSEAEVDGGVGEPFDSTAIATAQRLRFQPARDATGPRRAKVRVVIHFRPPASVAPPKLPRSPVEGNDQESPATSLPGVAPPSSSTTEVTVEGLSAHRSASELRLNERVLRAAPHKNGSELLSVVPGVFVSQHSGEGKAHQIFFRGFDASHGQDIELWAAGAPINDVSNVHGQGYADMHFLIPEVVREISATPGTYDPRQGDFAVAGTMRFGLGFDEPGTTVKATTGNFGTRRYFLGYHPKTASPGTFGAFELYDTDGFGPSRAARRGSAIGQAVFTLGGGIAGRVMASTYAGRFDSAGVVPLDEIRSGRIDRFATLAPKQGGYSSRTQFVVELASDPSSGSDDSRLSVAPFVVFRTLRLRSNFTGALGHHEGDSIQQFNDAVTMGATASYVRILRWFSERDQIETGVSLRNDNIRQSQHRLSSLTDRVTDDERAPGIDANLRATDVAGYIELSLNPIERVSIRGGLRADGLSYLTEELGGQGAGQVRSALGAQLSKRGTLDVGIVPNLRALASYGEGFRSPQVRSLGDGETTPFTRVVSYEIGLKYADARRLQASLAGYHTRLSDDLVLDPSTARNELVPSTYRLGITANVVAEPAPWFVSSVSLTYTKAAFQRSDARYRAGDLVPYVPQVVARSDVGARATLGRMFESELLGDVGLGTTYFGRRPLPYAEMGHDAFLVDGSVQLRLGPVQTRFEVFNVLGAEYFDGEFVYASRFGDASGLVPTRHVSVGAPRTWLWSLAVFI